MVKITMVVPGFSLRRGEVLGGVASSSLYLLKALLATGEVDADVLRADAPGDRAMEEIEGIRVRTLSRPNGMPPLYYRIIHIRRQVERCVEFLQPDIVHEQSVRRYKVGIIPSVITLHGIVEIDVMFSERFVDRCVRRLWYNLTEARERRNWKNVIAVSEYSKRFLGGSNERVWSIPNAVDDRYFAIAPRPVIGRIFTASRIRPLKNIEGLLYAFSKLASWAPEVTLRIAGDYADRAYGAKCMNLAAELGVASRVSFLGPLSVESMCEELSMASIFVLCSHQENAPVAIAEAMAAGVVVVANPVGAVGEMVEDQVTGLLAPSSNTELFAKGMLKALRAEGRGGLAIAARRKAKCCYHASMVAKMTIETYHELLQR